MSVDNLLEDWGLPELITVFSENGIDMEAVRLLSEDDIKQLLPKVGVRVKFIAKWREHFKKTTVPVQVFDVKLPPIEEFPAFADAALVPPTPLGSPNNIDSSVSTASADSEEDEDMELFAHRTKAESSRHVRAPSPSWVPPLKRQNAISFDARRILSQSHEGRSVIKHIDETGFLMKKERSKLVSILVGHLITKNGPKPSSFEKSALAESIVKSFPCLKDPDGISGFEAFYMKGTSGRPGSGYLEEHLRYVRKKMIEKKTSTDDDENSETSSESRVEVTPDLLEKVNWLKNNMEPTNQVHIFMAETFHYRKEMIKKRERSISEIISEFPRLMDAQMLDQDFQFMFPVITEKFMDNWGNFSEPIIQYGRQMHPMWQDTLGVGPLDLDTLPTDEKNNLALLMLPLIFESRSKGKGKGKARGSGGRCAIIDSMSAFIDLKLDITHLPSYLQNIDSAKKPQPYILCFYADNKLNPSQSMVVIERRAIPTCNMMAAVDICYKAHFVLDMQFQNLCHGVWDFIQTIVYEQPGMKCATTPSVRAFRAYLKNAVVAN